MPLKFERVVEHSQFGRPWKLQIHYRDEFGQPRYFEFHKNESSPDILKDFGKELIRQVNELLARPRPAEQSLTETVEDLRQRGMLDG